jgi:hypothetical protein
MLCLQQTIREPGISYINTLWAHKAKFLDVTSGGKYNKISASKG